MPTEDWIRIDYAPDNPCCTQAERELLAWHLELQSGPVRGDLIAKLRAGLDG